MLDLRGEDADWGELAEGLAADERPVMIVSERPRRLVRALSGRPAGTMLLTGSESDAGYRVALSVCQALRRSRPGARPGRRAPQRCRRAGGRPVMEDRKPNPRSGIDSPVPWRPALGRHRRTGIDCPIGRSDRERLSPGF